MSLRGLPLPMRCLLMMRHRTMVELEGDPLLLLESALLEMVLWRPVPLVWWVLSYFRSYWIASISCIFSRTSETCHIWFIMLMRGSTGLTLWLIGGPKGLLIPRELCESFPHPLFYLHILFNGDNEGFKREGCATFYLVVVLVLMWLFNCLLHPTWGTLLLMVSFRVMMHLE